MAAPSTTLCSRWRSSGPSRAAAAAKPPPGDRCPEAHGGDHDRHDERPDHRQHAGRTNNPTTSRGRATIAAAVTSQTMPAVASRSAVVRTSDTLRSVGSGGQTAVVPPGTSHFEGRNGTDGGFTITRNPDILT